MWRERTAIALGGVLAALSWLLMVIGALAFFCADRALHDFAHMSWGLAELIGMGIAAVCIIAGIALKSLRDS